MNEGALKTLFVTGGHGFVGQVIQRMAPEIAAHHGLAVALPPPDFDLLDPAQVDAQLLAARPAAILHLAAQSNVPRSFADPEESFRVNAIGTLRLFEGAKRAGLSPRVVYASSGDVYGRVPESQMPVTEEHLPRPRNPYAVSKLAAESLCFQWSQTERLDVVIARPFNHIGAGQSDAFVLPSFAKQIARIKSGRCEPVLDVGDIDVSRDFTHVADIVDAYLLLLKSGRPGEIYNIASGTGLQVRDLLLRMLEISGTQAEIRQDPTRMRPAEQRVMQGGNAKIRALGWHPTRPIGNALREILEEWERREEHG